MKVYLKNTLSRIQFDKLRLVFQIINDEDFETVISGYQSLDANELIYDSKTISREYDLFRSLPADAYLSHDSRQGLKKINSLVAGDEVILDYEEAVSLLENDPEFTEMIGDAMKKESVAKCREDCRRLLESAKKSFAFSEADLKKSYKSYIAHTSFLKNHFNDYYAVIEEGSHK